MWIGWRKWFTSDIAIPRSIYRGARLCQACGTRHVLNSQVSECSGKCIRNSFVEYRQSGKALFLSKRHSNQLTLRSARNCIQGLRFKLSDIPSEWTQEEASEVLPSWILRNEKTSWGHPSGVSCSSASDLAWRYEREEFVLADADMDVDKERN